MNTRHTSKLLVLLFLLCTSFFIVSQAEAKTVSVKEIIKTQQITENGVISLADTKNTPELTQQTQGSWAIATNPLFMETDTLKQNPKKEEIFSVNPSSAYTFTQNYTSTKSVTPENARLVITDNRVTDFSPGVAGVRVDVRKTTLALLRSLKEESSTSPIIGFSEQPDVTLADTNNLGISEFISGGLSNFSNSSKNRRTNIDVGMRKLRGVLVAPGELLSFDKYLGDVTAEDGFKPEIVIKADGLKPELGGGICQVSSTLFRAVMQSGMPINTRKNHAFSVSHYFPAGTDATVYSPYTDLKFTNDTPNYVLIWPYFVNDHILAFDLYGTRDSREVIVDEPLQWDRKPDGSLKASWTRHVTNNGVTRDDTLKSNYLPPALFKKEEKFVPAAPEVTPTPSPTPTSTPTPTTSPSR